MEFIYEIIKDTIFIPPLLFLMYIFLESLERKHNQRYEHYFRKYGPLFGSIVGLLPQCGFSVLASLLFIEQKITWGTLISVFIATSDEAIPLLLTNPHMYSSLLIMLLLKLMIAICVGYLVDFLHKEKYNTYTLKVQRDHHHDSLIIDAGIRTFKIYAFILGTQIILAYMINRLPSQQLTILFMNQSLFQPFICAIFGFIPNCASSVILTQLYMSQIISLASLLAGLMTNGGLGILILLQHKMKISIIFKTCFIVFVTSLFITIPMQWFHLFG